ncbi:MAG: signal peptidase I [Chloroflexota bacterium]|nr:signal peptidase I [Chloroflexota bacterium]
MKRSHLIREIVETIALTLIIFLVIHFAVQSYRVEGTSMNPGLIDNEYVLVNKVAFLFHQPERGDVIVFHAPKDPGRDYIKRVIGLPGDTILVTSTTVTVNGDVLKEPYISTAANPTANSWKVPQNQYFVLGDNRPTSDDSRDWGFVPKDYIVGQAVAVYWPLNNWQFIDTHPSVYTSIK